MQTIAIGKPGHRSVPIPALDLGTRVGPYRLEALLGSGGMGRVFRARHQPTGHGVALKTHGAFAEATSAAGFRREADLQGRVDHPGVVACSGTVQGEEDRWIVLELVEGFTLHRLLHGRSLDIHRFLDLARQITAGLGAIHRAGVLHCDLKAENILVSACPLRSEEYGFRTKILDFGIARELERSPRFARGRDRGTFRVLSPEQVLGRPLDSRSDLFSLGVLFYEMLTRISPFHSPRREEILRRVCSFAPPSVHRRAPFVPLRLSRLVDQLLEKNANRRPRSAEEVLARIEDSMALAA